MMSGRTVPQFPQPGHDDRSSRSEAWETQAWALDTRRSSIIAPELSRSAQQLTMVKDATRFDSSAVNLPAGGNRFNVYPDTVAAPVGVFMTALAVGVLIAGNAVAACVLIGWL